jgi:hypothetical protein
VRKPKPSVRRSARVYAVDVLVGRPNQETAIGRAPLLLVIGVVALLSGGNQLVALGLIGLPVALLVQEIRRR